MTTCSLLKEIECLNNDIDTCKSKLENKAIMKSTCPPNCYCDKRNVGIENRASLPITRTKTATASVTKSDIIPKSQRGLSVRIMPQECAKKSVTRPKTANNDCRVVDYDEILPCPKTKRETAGTQAPTKDRRMENICYEHSEPVKLSKKCSHVGKEPSWSAILHGNNVREAQSINPDARIVNRGKNSLSPTSSSSCNSVVYMKNKGIQYEEQPSVKPKSSPKTDLLNTIQYLMMNLKSKVKNDPALGNMLDEMEYYIRKIPPRDRGDNAAMNEFPIECRTYLDPHISPRPDLKSLQASRERIEATYLELEATCAKLKNERDSAVEAASLKSLELIESMKREAETKAKLNETNLKIKEMSAKLETYTKSMEGLTEHVKHLQKENKDLKRVSGQVIQLNKKMEEVSKENKNLLHELQVVLIERNKLEAELLKKEKELLKKTKELENASNLLLESTKQSPEVEERKNSFRSKYTQSSTQHDQRRQYSKRNGTACSPRPSSSQLVSSSPNTSSESLQKALLESWVAYSSISGGQTDNNEPDDTIRESDNTVNAAVLNSLSTNKKFNNNINNNVNFRENIENFDGQSLSDNTQSDEKQKKHTNERQPDVNKIEKLKDEIRRMFTDMRELARDVPSSIPAVEFTPMPDSSDINWSEMSNTVNSYDSVSDLASTEFNDFVERNKFNI